MAHLVREGLEPGVIADQVLDAPVDLVGEQREVCHLVDADLAIGSGGSGKQEGQDEQEISGWQDGFLRGWDGLRPGRGGRRRRIVIRVT